MEDVIVQAILGFTSQLAMLWARTYNVHANALLEVRNTILSGIIIHFLWLVGTSVSVNGTLKIMEEQDYRYLLVIFGTLIGSIIGTYIGLIQRRKAKNNSKL